MSGSVGLKAMKEQEMALDELEQLGQKPSEKLLERLFKLRCKVFGRPPTFVSKEGVHYYRGPQEVLMSERHRKEWEAHKNWLAHPDRLKQNLNVVELNRKIEEKHQRELEWARKQDRLYQVNPKN